LHFLCLVVVAFTPTGEKSRRVLLSVSPRVACVRVCVYCIQLFKLCKKEEEEARSSEQNKSSIHIHSNWFLFSSVVPSLFFLFAFSRSPLFVVIADSLLGLHSPWYPVGPQDGMWWASFVLVPKATPIPSAQGGHKHFTPISLTSSASAVCCPKTQIKNQSQYALYTLGKNRASFSPTLSRSRRKSLFSLNCSIARQTGSGCTGVRAVCVRVASGSVAKRRPVGLKNSNWRGQRLEQSARFPSPRFFVDSSGLLTPQDPLYFFSVCSWPAKTSSDFWPIVNMEYLLSPAKGIKISVWCLFCKKIAVPMLKIILVSIHFSSASSEHTFAIRNQELSVENFPFVNSYVDLVLKTNQVGWLWLVSVLRTLRFYFLEFLDLLKMLLNFAVFSII